ncbi:Protein lap1 [Orchesella cincta]|uniref:Protein lap1 n=1 Tax=Orchesella cincta TaxID=48709 RepID=A0A1D2MX71_ORCCI|nr:Protein lap1 [Orchesella cincta]
MTSLLTASFLKLKLDVSLEEAERLQSRLLDLRCHGLEECPDFNTRLSSKYRKTIQCLLLQINKLSEFNANVCNGLRNLKALSLDHNRLTDLPYEFRKLSYLTMLNVSHNQFSDLHFLYVICQLKTLRVLWANATGLREIPKEIQNLKKLRILGLRKNHLRSLPQELFSLQELQWLTLSSNEIQEIPYEISKLKQLVHLNLQHNCLKRLPESLNQLEELQYLLLQYNNLMLDEAFILFIRTLPKLIRCWLTGNLSDLTRPVNTLVQQICRRQTAAANITTALSVSSGSQPDEIEPQAITPNNDEYSQSALATFETREQQEQEDSTFLEVDSRSNVMETDDARILHRQSHPVGESSFLPMGEHETIIRDRAQEFPVHLSEHQLRGVMESACLSEIEQNEDSEDCLECYVHHPTLDELEDMKTEEHALNVNGHLCGSAQSPVKLASAALDNSSQEDKMDPHSYNPCGTRSTLGSRDSCNRIRMSRTREWVKCHSESQVSVVADIPYKTFDTDYNFNDDKAYLGSLRKTMEEQVDELIAESAKKVEQYSETRSAESRLLFVPLSNVHLPIPRAISRNTSGSMAPTEELVCLKAPIGINDKENRSEENETLSLVSACEECSLLSESNNDCTNIAQENVNTSTHTATCAPLGTINQIFTSATSIVSRSRLEFESNYDPSDFEHSTPSSAIDDQDFVSRFVDVNAEDNGSELVFDEDDVLAVVPRLLMIMPPANNIPIPLEHHPVMYVWHFCKTIIKHIRWPW